MSQHVGGAASACVGASGCPAGGSAPGSCQTGARCEVTVAVFLIGPCLQVQLCFIGSALSDDLTASLCPPLPLLFRLLYSLAFNARFLRHLWVLISSMTTRMITGYVLHLLTCGPPAVAPMPDTVWQEGVWKCSALF